MRRSRSVSVASITCPLNRQQFRAEDRGEERGGAEEGAGFGGFDGFGGEVAVAGDGGDDTTAGPALPPGFVFPAADPAATGAGDDDDDL